MGMANHILEHWLAAAHQCEPDGRRQAESGRSRDGHLPSQLSGCQRQRESSQKVESRRELQHPHHPPPHLGGGLGLNHRGG